MRHVLLREGDADLGLSKRGTQQLEEVRDLITAPERQGSFLLERLPSGRVRWWTFAGGSVNSALALRLGAIGSTRVDDLWVEAAPSVPVLALMHQQISPSALTALATTVSERRQLKFSSCLPPDLLLTVVVGRSIDEESLQILVGGSI